MDSGLPILIAAEQYVTAFIPEKVSADYAFHDIHHTVNVVVAVREIAQGFELGAEELEILQLAAWFHDTGYDQGPADHEERSVQYATRFLESQEYPSDRIAAIAACIRATKFPQQPQDLLERIICDADLSHLGKNIYWDRNSRLRQEMTLTRNLVLNEEQWLDFELEFILGHQFQTSVAEQLYGERKSKHIKQLRKQRGRLVGPPEQPSVEEMAALTQEDASKKEKSGKSDKEEVKSAFQLKQLNLGRGVETMYRSSYRTHTNLSAMADNKANIMLSINAIVLSIAVSTLVPKFDNDPRFIVPTIILLATGLGAMVFATLSTMPKVTSGKFTPDDIKQKRVNLLFFGNYYRMSLPDFHWGMMELIKDSDFLYTSMTKDLYYLGKVLAHKYALLRICYNVFMWGLIISVLSFAIIFTFWPGPELVK